MKLKIVLFFGLMTLGGKDIKGMLGGEVKKAADVVYPGAKTLNEAFNGLILDIGAHFEEILEALINQLSEDGIDKCKNSITDFLEAPQGTSFPEAIKHLFINRPKEYVKKTFIDLKSKLVIASTAIGITIIAYYLFKYYAHPGSLNKESLKKSNLLVESSGYRNDIVSKILRLFETNKALPKLILSSNLSQKVKGILNAFLAIIKHLKSGYRNLRFRSLLLTGPKGTGKRLLTDHLFKVSNLDYIRVNSTSFVNFDDGNTSLDKIAGKSINVLFGLLKNPKKEIIVAFDELDILLNKPHFKDRLMILLKWLKTNNHKFMLVFVAEDKLCLDKEVLSLADDIIELDLPQEQERKKFISNEIENILKENEKTGLGEILKSIFNAQKVDEIAKLSPGFSFENLQNMINQLKIELLKNSGQFTKEIVNKIIQQNLALKASLTA